MDHDRESEDLAAREAALSDEIARLHVELSRLQGLGRLDRARRNLRARLRVESELEISAPREDAHGALYAALFHEHGIAGAVHRGESAFAWNAVPSANASGLRVKLETGSQSSTLHLRSSSAYGVSAFVSLVAIVLLLAPMAAAFTGLWLGGLSALGLGLLGLPLAAGAGWLVAQVWSRYHAQRALDALATRLAGAVSIPPSMADARDPVEPHGLP